MSPQTEAPTVEVACAWPDRQRVVTVPLGEGLTAREAVDRSGLLQEFPALAVRPLLLGIYGRRVAADQPLVAGDRVELYRELPVDPRAARRQAARARR
jgi:putative ubiquitin-RnfH superfamily antitoxin RatB of RatAB toxin-antitoxin module